MTFLSPWLAVGIAAVVVPALVLLYFLKLRRREEPISSTLLWKRAVQDLQVNAPFQRLRRNLLLLLQLLVLAGAILALARPMIETTVPDETSLILLIDHSASMNTREVDRTRLDIAKEQAVGLVRQLNKTGSRWFSFGSDTPQTRVMVIEFADRASVVAPFTTNTTDLVGVIKNIEPTDAPTNLREALTLAEAYVDPEEVQTGSKAILFSDGRVADLDQVRLRHGALEYIPIGETRDNVGITALRVQRNYEQPEQVSVFLQVQNFGSQAVTTDVSLFIDNRLRSVREITLEPGEVEMPTTAPGDAAPQAVAGTAPQGSRVPLSFEFALDRAGVVRAQIVRDDALPADNAGYVVVPPPRKLRVLLVTGTKGRFYLDSVLAGLPLESVTRISPEQYEQMPRADLEVDGQLRYDVAILNEHDTERLPVGNYMFIAGVPKIEGVERTGEVEHLRVLWWDETHAILRHVALEYVYIAKALGLKLPDEAETIAEGPPGPLLARYARDGRQYLLLAFAVEQSSWVLKPSFTVFFYNALRYLGSAGAVGGPAGAAPGDTLMVQLPPDVEAVELKRPDRSTVKLKANAAGMAYYGGTSRTGLYRVEGGVEGRDTFAVNLLDDRESDIRPMRELRIGAQSIQQGQSISTSTPEIWRWFILAALVILLLEWYIYNRRVMV